MRTKPCGNDEQPSGCLGLLHMLSTWCPSVYGKIGKLSISSLYSALNLLVRVSHSLFPLPFSFLFVHIPFFPAKGNCSKLCPDRRATIPSSHPRAGKFRSSLKCPCLEQLPRVAPAGCTTSQTVWSTVSLHVCHHMFLRGIHATRSYVNVLCNLPNKSGMVTEDHSSRCPQ